MQRVSDSSWDFRSMPRVQGPWAIFGGPSCFWACLLRLVRTARSLGLKPSFLSAIANMDVDTAEPACESFSNLLALDDAKLTTFLRGESWASAGKTFSQFQAAGGSAKWFKWSMQPGRVTCCCHVLRPGLGRSLGA